MADGSDPTVILADDFSNDGVWYATDSDHVGCPASGGNVGSGELHGPNDGWKGTIFGFGCPANCIANAFQGNKYAYSTGERDTVGSSVQQGYAAWHYFGPTFPPSARTTYEEIYHRFYIKFLTGYDFGHEKIIAYHQDTSIDTQIGFFHSPDGGTKFKFNAVERGSGEQGPTSWLDQNQGNDLIWEVNKFYYIEVRIKLDTSFGARNGIVQVWGDDCGTDGLTDPGSGTLRLSYDDVPLRRSNDLALGIVYHEHWLPTDPEQHRGKGTCHVANVVVRTQRVGPLNFNGAPIKQARHHYAMMQS